jgi:hypothetical protein
VPGAGAGAGAAREIDLTESTADHVLATGFLLREGMLLIDAFRLLAAVLSSGLFFHLIIDSYPRPCLVPEFGVTKSL